jgi:hypothetical protein
MIEGKTRQNSDRGDGGSPMPEAAAMVGASVSTRERSSVIEWVTPKNS